MINHQNMSNSEIGVAPRVSVGLPVYNGVKTIEDVITDVLSQTYLNFELVISDNFSTDGTSEICAKFAAQDSRIRYIRQTENIGAIRNFQFVLEESTAPYFLWAASDDRRSPDFIEANVAFLEANPDYCASISKSRKKGGKFNANRMGDRPLNQASLEKKILTFFHGWHRAAIYYSLYRRDVLLNHPLLYQPNYLGHDWAVIMYTASQGHMQRLEQGEIVFGTEGVSNGVGHIRDMRKLPIEYVFPHWRLSMYLKDISKDFSWRARVILFYRALLLNVRANLMRLIYIWDR
jgi:glycosyltransferase involved in cell wall biosynthesis